MKRKKIVLYNPKAVFFTMPLSLVAIGSMLDAKKYEVIIIDGRLEENPLQAVLAATKDALCFGVTVLTGNPLNDALQMTQAVKKSQPNLPIIWGGWHPSLFPTDTLRQESSVDVTVQGQGEVTFKELVTAFAENQPLKTIKGICYRDQDKITQNPPRLIVDMDELPPANYELIPVEAYFELKGKRQFDYISSTGCFFRCAFCADPFVYNRKWSSISAERMGSELSAHYQKYKFDDIDFQDETFFTYKKRVMEIADQFVKHGIKTTWAGTMRADQGHRISNDEFAKLAKAGLRRVLIGVESGSQEMMDWMQKDIKLEHIFECAEKCRDNNIAVIFPFIVGFPNETDKSVQDSLTVIKKLRAMDSAFETPIFYFKPYPGSKITQDVVANGFKLPKTLTEWADFDIIGSSGPWVTEEKHRLIERFKFYNRVAWGKSRWYDAPLRKVAQWRCDNDVYTLPVEKQLVEWMKPKIRLS